MSTEPSPSKLPIEELASRFGGDLIPLTSKFSYFTTLPVAEEDLRQYLNDPVAAISPAICEALASVTPPGGLLITGGLRAERQDGDQQSGGNDNLASHLRPACV